MSQSAKKKSTKKNVPVQELSSSTHSLWNDSLHNFRSEIDHLFDRFFGRHSAHPERDPFERLSFFEGAELSPNVDIRETSKTITLTAELPGMEEKDIDLSIEDGVLSLKGEKKYEHEDKDENAVRIERRYGSFQRVFTLPANVDEDGINAKFEKGVLVVNIPKDPKAAPKGRSVPIN
jgi:HSP20 family protein